MLSERAEKWLSMQYPLMTGFKKSLDRPFDIDTSPEGCINMGTAENSLMIDMLQEKIGQSKATQITLADTKYGSMAGSLRFRQAISKFLNRQLNLTDIAIVPEDISVHNGCGSVVEALGHVLGDPGDVFIVPGPYYGGFDMDLNRRANLDVVPAHASKENKYVVTKEDLERTFHDATVRQGKGVRALLAMNPVNPQANIYTDEVLLEMLDFCQSKDIHFVLDEIYACSIFNGKTFKSLYTFDQVKGYLDKVHLIWGFSKDFCLNGFRCGVMISKNPRLIKAMGEQAYFTALPSIADTVLSELLEDDLWTTKFVQLNTTRLQQSYQTVLSWLTQTNDSFKRDFPHVLKSANPQYNEFMPFVEPEAGFFIWIDFALFLGKTPTKEKESALWITLIEQGGVYLALGEAFHGSDPGWFRMVFAMEDRVLYLALNRIGKVLRSCLENEWGSD